MRTISSFLIGVALTGVSPSVHAEDIRGSDDPRGIRCGILQKDIQNNICQNFIATIPTKTQTELDKELREQANMRRAAINMTIRSILPAGITLDEDRALIIGGASMRTEENVRPRESGIFKDTKVRVKGNKDAISIQLFTRF